jgi:hypothetical protein
VPTPPPLGPGVRHTITPDSFTVDPTLLGLPLARPSRRLAAMLLDLLVVAFLANAAGAFLLALSAAYVSFRIAARFTGEGRGPAGRGVRLALRLAGAILLFVVAVRVAGGASRWVRDRTTDRPAAEMRAASAAAEPARRTRGGAPAPAARDSLVLELAAAVGAGDTAGVRALEPAVASVLARDSLDRLAARLAAERRARRDLERRMEEARTAGVIAWIVDFLDEMGLGLGWLGLYFTGFVALWRGQTPGKRLLGIRVLRLDGKPMGFWMSFERFGGYAAGLFTGLTGFAQVYWDPNRQMIHDKIVETVVVREAAGAARGAPPATRAGTAPDGPRYRPPPPASASRSARPGPPDPREPRGCPTS